MSKTSAVKKGATVMGNAPSFSAELLKSGWLADAEIQCQGRTRKCHKLIICGQSKWFERALMGNLHEAKTGIVHITSFTAEEVDVLLKFLYTGNVETTTEFNEYADNPFIIQMRLHHLADYFQIPKLLSLVCRACQDHTEALGKDLSRFPTPATPEPFKTASVQLFDAIQELYGKYYKHGQYPGHARSVKSIFKPKLMQLLVCNVHEVAKAPCFKALLHQYYVFAADWAFYITQAAGRRGSIDVESFGPVVQCTECPCVELGSLIVYTPRWIMDGASEVKCAGCFTLATHEVFTEP